MADDNIRPMTGADINPRPGDAPRMADPVKTTGDQAGDDVGSTASAPAMPMGDPAADTSRDASTGEVAGEPQNKMDQAKQLARDNYAKYGQQAADKARGFAETGKQRAGGALDQVTQMLNDAAAQVDEKLGGQYGQYARQAANQVQGLSDQVKNKDVDEFVDDVRAFVRKSPAVAIGVAAAVGFALARVVQSGIDDAARDSSKA